MSRERLATGIAALWIVLVVLVSSTSFLGEYGGLALYLLVGIGVLLLGYMAGLEPIVQLALLLYLALSSFLLAKTGPPENIREPYMLILCTPMLVCAAYSWIKRPKAN
uniref:Uncharacterized protein n=1 Tax=Fervidicoccus fontis TaxID=683846 RepID=A0A7J3ZJH9_9CREN